MLRPMHLNEITLYLKENRKAGVPVLKSIPQKILKGQNTADHNNAIGRLVSTIASTYFL